MTAAGSWTTHDLVQVADEKMRAQHTAPIIVLFEQRFEETFTRLGE